MLLGTNSPVKVKNIFLIPYFWGSRAVQHGESRSPAGLPAPGTPVAPGPRLWATLGGLGWVLAEHSRHGVRHTKSSPCVYVCTHICVCWRVWWETLHVVNVPTLEIPRRVHPLQQLPQLCHSDDSAIKNHVLNRPHWVFTTWLSWWTPTGCLAICGVISIAVPTRSYTGLKERQQGLKRH